MGDERDHGKTEAYQHDSMDYDNEVPGVIHADRYETQSVAESAITDHDSMEAMLHCMRLVEVKDRRWRLITYRQCFVGSDAVDLLVGRGYASSREEAVMLGRRMQKDYDLFEHVTKDHPFADEHFFYRFKKQPTYGVPRASTASPASASGRATARFLPSSPKRTAAGKKEQRMSGKKSTLPTISQNRPMTSERSASQKDSSRSLGQSRRSQPEKAQPSEQSQSRSGGSRRRSHTSRGSGSLGFASALAMEPDQRDKPRHDPAAAAARADEDADEEEDEEDDISDVSPHSAGESASDLNEAKMAEMARTVRDVVDVRDRRYHMVLYKNCFVGKEAVDVMLRARYARSRPEAVRVLRRLAEDFDLFDHVTGEHPFKDQGFFYRFKESSSHPVSNTELLRGCTPSLEGQLAQETSGGAGTDGRRGQSTMSGANQGEAVSLESSWRDQSTRRSFSAERTSSGNGAGLGLGSSGGRGSFVGSELSSVESRGRMHRHGDPSHADEPTPQVRSSQSHQTNDLEAIVLQTLLRKIRHVEVKDRKWRLRTYKQCFVGSDAVDLMVEEGFAQSRSDAVQLGRRLAEQHHLFEHVTADHAFEDDYLFYHFTRPFPQEDDHGSEGNDSGNLEEKILDGLVTSLRKIKVKDRVFRMKKYRQCFVGSEAVDLLVARGYAQSRQDAVRIGRHVAVEFNLFHHVLDEHHFKDEYLFYRFNDARIPESVGGSVASGSFFAGSVQSVHEVGDTMDSSNDGSRFPGGDHASGDADTLLAKDRIATRATAAEGKEKELTSSEPNNERGEDNGGARCLRPQVHGSETNGGASACQMASSSDARSEDAVITRQVKPSKPITRQVKPSKPITPAAVKEKVDGLNRTYSMAEVRRHLTDESGHWIVVNNKVYDCTQYLPRHPDGGNCITRVSGTDATNAFYRDPHMHSIHAWQILTDKCYIGDLDSRDCIEHNLDWSKVPTSASMIIPTVKSSIVANVLKRRGGMEHESGEVRDIDMERGYASGSSVDVPALLASCTSASRDHEGEEQPVEEKPQNVATKILMMRRLFPEVLGELELWNDKLSSTADTSNPGKVVYFHLSGGYLRRRSPVLADNFHDSNEGYRSEPSETNNAIMELFSGWESRRVDALQSVLDGDDRFQVSRWTLSTPTKRKGEPPAPTLPKSDWITALSATQELLKSRQWDEIQMQLAMLAGMLCNDFAEALPLVPIERILDCFQSKFCLSHALVLELLRALVDTGLFIPNLEEGSFAFCEIVLSMHRAFSSSVP